jgi:hypothetical protein
MQCVGLTEMGSNRTALALALVMTLWSTQRVFACSCERVWNPDYRKALRAADAVFQGTVREVLELQSLALRVAVFDVEGSWRGVKAERAFVFTGRGGGDCGLTFEVGKAYVVWASREGWQVSGELSTSTCSFTAPVEEASSQLAQLGKPKGRKQ